jgi:two-component system, OmpR family, sensor histidine kinase MprB
VTLRARLALVIGTLVVVAISLASTAAYLTSSTRLHKEIDTFVSTRAADLTDVRLRGPRGRGPLANPNPIAVSDDDPDTPPGFVPPSLGGRQLAGLDAVVQVLDADGAVYATVGLAEPLPVSPGEMAVARGDAGHVLRTSDAGDDSFRVATQARAGGGAIQVARSLEETNRILRSLKLRFASIAVLGTALSALAVWLVVRRASRPIEVLAARARHVAATQDLSVAMDVNAPGEVGQLASSFNAMLRALGASKAQQQRLVQDAGHELRTPLTSLRTNIDVLGQIDRLPPEDRGALIADLKLETEELSALVEELIELATDHRRSEQPELVRLDEVAETVVERARRRSGRDISVEALDTHPVLARRSQLDRAVTNLVDNALKFSDGSVDVAVGAGSVKVRDHGPGISVDDLPQLFERFYRSDQARATPGSGLGLAIVAQFADDHGGSVSAENADQGGAVVGFTLPVSV